MFLGISNKCVVDYACAYNGTGFHWKHKTKNCLSPKKKELPKFCFDWHKTLAILIQALVAVICNVSSSYYKNSLFHLYSKNVLQMSSSALQAHLDQMGKVLYDHLAFLPCKLINCCCDHCLHIRDSLWVVAMHPVFSPFESELIWSSIF